MDTPGPGAGWPFGRAGSSTENERQRARLLRRRIQLINGRSLIDARLKRVEEQLARFEARAAEDAYSTMGEWGPRRGTRRAGRPGTEERPGRTEDQSEETPEQSKEASEPTTRTGPARPGREGRGSAGGAKAAKTPPKPPARGRPTSRQGRAR